MQRRTINKHKFSFTTNAIISGTVAGLVEFSVDCLCGYGWFPDWQNQPSRNIAVMTSRGKVFEKYDKYFFACPSRSFCKLIRIQCLGIRQCLGLQVSSVRVLETARLG
jgi:hypothetical protein